MIWVQKGHTVYIYCSHVPLAMRLTDAMLL